MATRFTALEAGHIPEAIALAQADLVRETRHIPALATANASAILAERVTHIARSGIGGVAAVEGDQLVGYLVFMGPFPRFFGATPGAWSPLHAHALGVEDRERMWSLLVQHASERLVAQGVTGLSITTYAHDEGSRGLLLNSFGIRLADAIRDLHEPFPFPLSGAAIYTELTVEQVPAIVPLENALIRHLRSTPMYLPLQETTEERFMARQRDEDARFFAAWAGERLVGYVKVTDDGETFITESPEIQNISGAYLEPAYRGRGIYDSLVAFTANTLRAEGAALLGVDCETMNPNALRFWGKYFDNYTYTYVRRIDERILDIAP